MHFLLKIIYFITLLSAFYQPASAAICRDFFSINTSEFKKNDINMISWKDIKDVETAFYAFRSGDIEWQPGWNLTGWRRNEETLEFGQGILNGEKVFFKKLSSERPNEIAILHTLNSEGLGPKLTAIFRKHNSDWFVTEFVEGSLFRLDYSETPNGYAYGPTVDGTAYLPHWRNNTLIGVVTRETLGDVSAAFSKFNKLGVAAHDFQFLITDDGRFHLIDVGHYQLSPDAKKINDRILSIVSDNLNMLLNGIRVPKRTSSIYGGGDPL